MQAVQALPASFGSSLRPVSTSNGAGSRAAGSRGPWSSAELATRPVRKGPPKPKGNAPDSRKTRTSNHRIPESGKGFLSLRPSLPNFGSPSHDREVSPDSCPQTLSSARVREVLNVGMK